MIEELKKALAPVEREISRYDDFVRSDIPTSLALDTDQIRALVVAVKKNEKAHASSKRRILERSLAICEQANQLCQVAFVTDEPESEES